MYNQKYTNRHRKGSLSQFNGTSQDKITVKTQRAFSNEERTRTHSLFEKSQELSCIEQEKHDLQMIKKELLQFQQDVLQKNQIKKKKNIREFKDKVEVFMYSVKFLIIKQVKNHSNSYNFFKTNEGSINDNDRTFPQENSIFQQNEETSILLKDQDKKQSHLTSANKEFSRYPEQASDDQLNELQELLQILNECINELSIILEQKALLKEDELGIKRREVEYEKEIDSLEMNIKQIQNSKFFQKQNFQNFNKNIQISRYQNLVQFFQEEYNQIKSQINELVQEIFHYQVESNQIQDQYSYLIQVKNEISLMKDGFIVTDQNILNLFDIDFIINVMDKKKSEDAIQAIIKIQNFFIQEIEQLLEEKQKGCFSVYDCLLNLYDASNKHLIKVFNENPILEFQQKQFLQKQQKINQIIKEKQQFITQSQENVFFNFPQLKDFVETFKNNSTNLCMLILENQNKLNLSILFRLLHNSFKSKLNTGMYLQVMTNINNLPQLQANIEKNTQKISSLEDKAVLLKYKLNINKSIQESITINYSKFINSQQVFKKNKFDPLEDIKLSINNRKNSLHTSSNQI